jgi:hypothetical protein
MCGALRKVHEDGWQSRIGEVENKGQSAALAWQEPVGRPGSDPKLSVSQQRLGLRTYNRYAVEVRVFSAVGVAATPERGYDRGKPASEEKFIYIPLDDQRTSLTLNHDCESGSWAGLCGKKKKITKGRAGRTQS